MLDRVHKDAELGAFASRMHQTDGRRFWIDNINRATVRNVNTQRDTAFIRHNAVAAGETSIFAADTAAATAAATACNCDFVSVNLFGGEQRPVADADCIADFVM